ncbi:MAG: hypothetical protein FGF51_01935 [Candidatus Brockarchaeota archaeon]|nr:hypothetical protein [Candidatus Brockarchaeota archaeon]
MREELREALSIQTRAVPVVAQALNLFPHKGCIAHTDLTLSGNVKIIVVDSHHIVEKCWRKEGGISLM